MNIFISCDWGTSAFRLRLVNADTQHIISEVKTEQGIATVYNEWTDHHQSTERVSFYTKFISEGIQQLEQDYGNSLTHIPIVISGMASSSIGMIELPYKQLPFCIDGSDLLTHKLLATPAFQHHILFISGAKTSDDVMRGEETKLIGIDIKNTDDEQLIIMPGTHAKHVVVKNGLATTFQTFMTGELFNLLSTKSVLASSVEANKEEHFSYFIKGIADAKNSNVLNSIFHVRTYRLFNYHTSKQNYHYLSGLLIGSELKELLNKKYSNIILIATGVFERLYKLALQELNLQQIKYSDADEALLKGQCKMYFRDQHQP